MVDAHVTEGIPYSRVSGANPAAPGLLKRLDLKLGFDCHCNCLFCVVGDLLYSKDYTTEENKEVLRKARERCDSVTFTGGEPTMRGDFIELVGYARSIGYRNIQVQTTGRMFSYAWFAARSIRAGLTEICFAIHGSNARIHDAAVRTKGSFDEIMQGLDHLLRLKQSRIPFSILVNTVVVRQNMTDLPDIARMVAGRRVDQFQLAFVNPKGHALRYFEHVVPRVSEAKPYIHEALRIGIEAGIPCMAEAMPFCQMQGFERHVSELYIPYTEITVGERRMGDYRSGRLESDKTRFPQCAECRYELICEGPWKGYPDRMGSEEFQPVPGPKIYHPSAILHPNGHRLGRQAPEFTLASADGKTVRLSELRGRPVVIYFYPEDGTPECTREACGFRDTYDRYRAMGIEVLGISPDPAEKHELFAQSNMLPFSLLSDPRAETARAYGSFYNGIRRSTFLVGPDQSVIHVFHQVEDPYRHAQEVLDVFQKYQERSAVSPPA